MQFLQLQGQIQSLSRGTTVDDDDHGVGFTDGQILRKHGFIRRKGAKRKRAGEIDDAHGRGGIGGGQNAFTRLHGDAGPVACAPGFSRQAVEERCFSDPADTEVADKLAGSEAGKKGYTGEKISCKRRFDLC